MPMNLDEMFNAVLRDCLAAAMIGVLCFVLVMAVICLLAWLKDRLDVEDNSPEAGRPGCADNPTVGSDEGDSK